MSKYLLMEAPEYIAYHGSDRTFKKFSYEYLGSSSGNARFGPGFYFAKTKGTVGRYGERTTKWNVRIDRPVSLTDRSIPKEIESLIRMSPDYSFMFDDISELRTFARVIADLPNQLDSFLEVRNTFFHDDKDYFKAMRKLGYDGVIVPKNVFGDDEVYVVFDKDKITK